MTAKGARSMSAAWVTGMVLASILTLLATHTNPWSQWGLLRPSTAAATDPEPAVRASAKKIEDLSCFTCHNIEHYREGSDFSHAAHEDLGHCHLCHAFEGHFETKVREEVCDECH